MYACILSGLRFDTRQYKHMYSNIKANNVSLCGPQRALEFKHLIQKEVCLRTRLWCRDYRDYSANRTPLRTLTLHQTPIVQTKTVADYHNNNYKQVLTRWLKEINLAKYKDAFLEKIMAPSDFKLVREMGRWRHNCKC